MNAVRTVDPTAWVLTLAQLRAQCRVPDDLIVENDYLLGLGKAADSTFEQYANRGLLPQTWTLGLQDWFDRVDLPMAAPLRSVVSVKYRAADGTLTTIASSYYQTDTLNEPARLLRAPNVVWPSLQPDRLGSRVEVTYTVGYATADVVPAGITRGMLLLVSDWFWNRVPVGEISGGVTGLWASYRVHSQPMVCA